MKKLYKICLLYTSLPLLGSAYQYKKLPEFSRNYNSFILLIIKQLYHVIEITIAKFPFSQGMCIGVQCIKPYCCDTIC